MLTRAIAGGLLAVVATFVARRARTLSMSGALTSAVVGALAIAAGWSWGFLLLSVFVSASALSKLGERKKAKLVSPVVQKGDERDAGQGVLKVKKAEGGDAGRAGTRATHSAFARAASSLPPPLVRGAAPPGGLPPRGGEAWHKEGVVVGGGVPVDNGRPHTRTPLAG